MRAYIRCTIIREINSRRREKAEFSRELFSINHNITSWVIVNYYGHRANLLITGRWHKNLDTRVIQCLLRVLLECLLTICGFLNNSTSRDKTRLLNDPMRDNLNRLSMSIGDANHPGSRDNNNTTAIGGTVVAGSANRNSVIPHKASATRLAGGRGR